MSPEFEKLVKRLQATYQFVTTRSNRHPVFEEVVQELRKIDASLSRGKLTIEIFSQFPVLTQGLHSFFSTRQALPQFYQFKISNLPIESQPIQPNSPPALILQENSAIGQQETPYELSENQNIIIAREPQPEKNSRTLQITLPKYGRISNPHAEIQPLISSASQRITWQICDLNSRNGTYIHGQRINGCKTLQPGDKITLASPSPSEKYPEFLFKYQTNISTNNRSTSQPCHGELVCLVIDPKQMLSNAEKQLIDNISSPESQVIALIIIADSSGADNQIIQQINANLATIENWIKVQYPSLSVELTHLQLQPFYPSSASFSVDSNMQQEFEKFCEPLVMLGKNQGKDILVQRLNQQLLSQIARIEQVIKAQEQTLTAEIQQTETKLQGRTIGELEERIRKAFNKVNEDKQEVFRQVKFDLSRSKSDLINSYSQNSLMSKIKEFIDKELNPVVTKPGGQICIELQSKDNKEGHQAIIEFCQNQLTKWVNEEWWRICNIYVEDGINGLIGRSYVKLNCIPSLTLSNSFSPPQLKIDFQKSLQDSFVAMEANSSYNNNSFNPLIGGAAKIGVQAITAAGIAYINPVAAALQAPRIVENLVGFVGSFLTRTQQQNYKLEEITTKLRQNGCNYYQSLTKSLVDRLVQDISIALEAEERRFKRTLEPISEQLAAYLNDINNCKEGYKVRQNNFLQEKAALEQIKRI
jgi:pSer/pThr/pTyr-binding forkhead associated (FHA) protein